MEKESKLYVDVDGNVWTNLGDGIHITNFDGSPFVPIDWDNLRTDPTKEDTSNS